MSGLIMFVVYVNPRDYPGKWVVRRWVGLVPDQHPLSIADDVETARLSISATASAMGLIRMAPMPGDDPIIAEVWF